VQLISSKIKATMSEICGNKLKKPAVFAVITAFFTLPELFPFNGKRFNEMKFRHFEF
jgi:hypothetical protein